MDLNRLRIDRSGSAKRRRAGWGRAVRWVILAVVLGVALWILRRPIGSLYERLTLPSVETARAVKTSPLAASAVSGTAANGYIVAARRAALSSDFAGRVIELNVEEGAVVKKGDVVARLFSKEYEAAVARARGELGAAEAAVAQVRAELEAAKQGLESLKANVTAAEERIKEAQAIQDLAQVQSDREVDLLKKGAGTQDAVDQAKANLIAAIAKRNTQGALLRFAQLRLTETGADIRVVGARLRQFEAVIPIRQAQLDEALAFLEKTEVRAPFDGVVVLKDAEVGEVVSPNSQGGNSRGSVVTMVDFRSLEVQVDLPEKSLSAVAIGTAASIYLDAYPRFRYAGKVKRIWPTANRQKGSVELRIVFEKPDERLRPEMSVRVVFQDASADAPEPGEAEEPVILIPDDCVTKIDGRTGVFALERDVVRWRPVRLGERRGGRVVVESGLQGGEDLVA
ncbi:MAG: efflux RND transporter periplasmic adaptor subunit, partial [Planctomycetota bacterium]